MKLPPKKVTIPLAIIIALVVAWHIVYPSGTWRYRMTVTVSTPEGDKTGSAVREVEVSAEPAPLPDMTGASVTVKGEAVVVDLGKRGVLFALMSDDEAVVYEAFPYEADGAGAHTPAGIRYYNSLKPTVPVTLPPKDYPMFVTFKDLKNPKTVEAVSAVSAEGKPAYKQGETVKTFQSAFGTGVHLKSVTIQITNKSVTWGIEKWIPWLQGRKNIRGTLGGGPEHPFQDPTGLYLTGIEFSKGKFW